MARLASGSAAGISTPSSPSTRLLAGSPSARKLGSPQCSVELFGDPLSIAARELMLQRGQSGERDSLTSNESASLRDALESYDTLVHAQEALVQRSKEKVSPCLLVLSCISVQFYMTGNFWNQAWLTFELHRTCWQTRSFSGVIVFRAGVRAVREAARVCVHRVPQPGAWPAVRAALCAAHRLLSGRGCAPVGVPGSSGAPAAQTLPSAQLRYVCVCHTDDLGACATWKLLDGSRCPTAAASHLPARICRISRERCAAHMPLCMQATARPVTCGPSCTATAASR